jgi:hypothetical protein
MNTTAAAAQAGVTIPTIRRWCRYGVVAAAKQAGRWIIEAASLSRRIVIGRKAMTDTPTFEVKEGANKYGSTTYTVARTDGTSDWRTATYSAREHAELHADFLNRVPGEYRIKRDSYPSRSIRSGLHFWRIFGGRNGDPSNLDHTWDDGTEVKGSWPEGTRPVDVLVALANRHAEGADARIAQHAEKQAVAAAEQAVREARETQMAEARAAKGELATPRQVEYILQLLEARKLSGEGGGFATGPTNRAEIELLSKGQASMYITSLKGDY